MGRAVTDLITYRTWERDTANTTDATTTPISTIACAASTTTCIDAMIVARRTGGSSGTAEDGAVYHLYSALKNVAGTATEIAAEIVSVIGEDQAAWDVTLTVSGANALINVVGAANNDIAWVCNYHLTTVSTV